VSDRPPAYAFTHSDETERRRLELLEQRLDPLTVRRITALGTARGSRCLEIGAGHGSIARWLCEHVGPTTATDLEIGFLSELQLADLTVLRHDVTVDDFPPGSFDLVHARTVLMHLPHRMATLRRMASWLSPGGWLLVEDADFGLWMGDFDRVWAAHPPAWHEAFPNGSLSQGRALLRQIHKLGLSDIGADGEVDIIQAGTPMAEFARLSTMRTAEPKLATGVIDAGHAAALSARIDEPDFLACGFVHIGAWGRRPPGA
jgi:SAM-dependent methyltransferase